MMPADFSLAQRVALYPGVCKERCAEGPTTQSFDVVPGATQVLWVDYCVSEYERRVPAVQENFSHQHTRSSRAAEKKSLVPIGPPQALENDLHTHTGTATRYACRE